MANNHSSSCIFGRHWSIGKKMITALCTAVQLVMLLDSQQHHSALVQAQTSLNQIP